LFLNEFEKPRFTQTRAREPNIVFMSLSDGCPHIISKTVIFKNINMVLSNKYFDYCRFAYKGLRPFDNVGVGYKDRSFSVKRCVWHEAEGWNCSYAIPPQFMQKQPIIKSQPKPS